MPCKNLQSIEKMTTKISFAIKESILIIIVIKNIKKHSIIWSFISSWKVHEVRLNKRNLSLFYQSCLVFLWHQEKGVRVVLLVLSSMRVYFHGKTLNNIDRNQNTRMLTRQRFSLNNGLLRLLSVAGSEKLVMYISMHPHQLRAISSSQITLR